MSARPLRHTLLVAAASALALLGEPAAARTQEPDSARVVRLGPGDVVRLQVFPEGGLLALDRVDLRSPLEYDVDSFGQVLLPVAGLIQVSGRDFDDVSREIHQAFAHEFANAAVRVVPLLRIAVLGEVRLPRLLPVDPTITLSDAVAAVGGLTEMANQGDIRLVRGEQTIVRTSSNDIAQVRTPLESGDRIVVGRRSWASQNTPFLLSAGTSIAVAVLTSLLLR